MDQTLRPYGAVILERAQCRSTRRDQLKSTQSTQINSGQFNQEERMARSLDDFAQDACADVLRDGALLPLLEAHATEQAYVFALANLPQGEERQSAFFTLGAHFGNDPATGDAPLTDIYLRSEAWVRLLERDEALPIGRISEDPQHAIVVSSVVSSVLSSCGHDVHLACVIVCHGLRAEGGQGRPTPDRAPIRMVDGSTRLPARLPAQQPFQQACVCRSEERGRRPAANAVASARNNNSVREDGCSRWRRRGR